MDLRSKYDVVIVGGGPGGTASALHLLKQGITPLIIEKSNFPRFHIGESLTGEVAGFLRSVGLESEMLREQHPIKRGVKVFGPEGKNEFWVATRARSPEWEPKTSFTYSVRRDIFDKMLFDTAIERGVEILDGLATTPIMEDSRVVGVEVMTRDGSRHSVFCEVLIDASGQATFLAKHGITGPKKRGTYNKQAAVFSHFAATVRGDNQTPEHAPGNTLLFHKRKLHWAWFIPVSAELTSVGVVMPSEYLKKQKLSKGELLRQEIQTLNPELAKRVPDLEFEEPVRAASSYSYSIENYAGGGFICVGDSHRFVDPIFSFGVYAALKEAELAVNAICQYRASGKDALSVFEEYQKEADQGQDAIQQTVDFFWEYPLAFGHFAHERYVLEMSDVFAGRVYGKRGAENPCLAHMRQLLASGASKTIALKERELALIS